MEDHLVPGRACGECNACCEHLAIDIPELKKPGGVLCQHCVPGKGCGIYDTRPNLCRNWYCGYRLFPDLNEDWRPDRCGILTQLVFDDIPPGFGKAAAKYTLLDVRAVLWPPFVTRVAASVDQGVPVFLQLNLRNFPIGKKGFLNTHPGLVAAVKTHSFPEIAGAISKVVGTLVDDLEIEVEKAKAEKNKSA